MPLERNQRTPEGEAIIHMSRRFLYEVLMPRLSELGAENLEEIEFRGMVAQFRSDNPGLGSNFEIAHVWGQARLRVEEITFMRENDPGTLPPDSDLILKANRYLCDLPYFDSPSE